MNSTGKQYVPVGPFEKATGLCPTYLAWSVAHELEQYSRVRLPAGVTDQLARRAERVWAANPTWQRKCKGRHGRAYLVSFMRHWLAAILCDHQPSLFHQLPDSYQIGHPLSVGAGQQCQTKPTRTRPASRTSAPRSTARLSH